ncbi:MAG: succinylglutamate desuccinylase/aspartoacylase family protein [Pseudomonadota bacterium]
MSNPEANPESQPGKPASDKDAKDKGASEGSGAHVEANRADNPDVEQLKRRVLSKQSEDQRASDTKTQAHQNGAYEVFAKALPDTVSGDEHTIKFYRFGSADARPKAYLQAGLHADELPGQLVLRMLIEQLEKAAERGDVIGQIVVVPVANPIGRSQVEGGYMQGRVEKETGRNFNRGFPDLAALARKRVVGRFDTEDETANTAKIRKGMLKGLAAIETNDAFESMQIELLSEACDADIVLDLHADNEALMHLYTQQASWPEAQDLAAELDARAVLLADISGGEPFDETCSRPWYTLKEKQPDAAIAHACFSATVELRSNNDVSTDYAQNDAQGLFRFLMRRGLIAGEAGSIPRLLCDATDLRAMQQVRSPCEGLIDYKLRLGDRVRKGDVIAEIIPAEGEIETICAITDGILFARHNQTWAWTGKVIGKVAGSEVLEERQGHLLTD